MPKRKSQKRYETSPEKLKKILSIRSNVIDPINWAVPETLLEVVKIPNLRGMVYGYVAEYEFARYLREQLDITEYERDDDHKKTKSDLNFTYNGKRYTVQVKCLQTTLIRPIENNRFYAVAQNDASDKRVVVLSNGDKVNTTCYVAGEYDILVSTVQPFTGKWDFIFKKNKDLRRTTYRGHTAAQQQYLLASQEVIIYPLEQDSGWTYDLLSLLDDPDLGNTYILEETDQDQKLVVDVPASNDSIIIETKKGKSTSTS